MITDFKVLKYLWNILDHPPKFYRLDVTIRGGKEDMRDILNYINQRSRKPKTDVDEIVDGRPLFGSSHD